MYVNDLRPKCRVEKIELTITEMEEPRGFIDKSGIKGNICSAVAKDDKGERVGLTLWNDEIERVNESDRVIITNGWVKEWYGQLEISTGRLGTLEVLR